MKTFDEIIEEKSMKGHVSQRALKDCMKEAVRIYVEEASERAKSVEYFHTDTGEWRYKVDKQSILSVIAEAEQALEIALKHMPDEFVWENNGSDSVMSWVLKAMIEFRNDN